MKRFVLMLALVALAVSPLAAQTEVTVKNGTGSIRYYQNDPTYGRSIVQESELLYAGYKYPTIQEGFYSTIFTIRMIETAEGFTYQLEFSIRNHGFLAGEKITGLALIIDDLKYTVQATEISITEGSEPSSRSIFVVQRNLIEKIMEAKERFMVIPIASIERTTSALYVKKGSNLKNFIKNVATTINPDPKNRKKYRGFFAQGTPFTF